MIRDQIHSTISLYQHNVLRHSFMDKLKEESVSFCGDSFIPRVVGIGIVAMGCLPIELPPFWWRDSFRPVSQVYQDRHRGFYSARWTRRPLLLRLVPVHQTGGVNHLLAAGRFFLTGNYTNSAGSIFSS